MIKLVKYTLNRVNAHKMLKSLYLEAHPLIYDYSAINSTKNIFMLAINILIGNNNKRVDDVSFTKIKKTSDILNSTTSLKDYRIAMKFIVYTCKNILRTNFNINKRTSRECLAMDFYSVSNQHDLLQIIDYINFNNNKLTNYFKCPITHSAIYYPSGLKEVLATKPNGEFIYELKLFESSALFLHIVNKKGVDPVTNTEISISHVSIRMEKLKADFHSKIVALKKAALES